MKKEKKFVRVCISLDASSIELLEELSGQLRMSKSEFIKFILYYYKNTYGFKTDWLRK